MTAPGTHQPPPPRPPRQRTSVAAPSAAAPIAALLVTTGAACNWPVAPTASVTRLNAIARFTLLMSASFSRHIHLPSPAPEPWITMLDVKKSFRTAKFFPARRRRMPKAPSLPQSPQASGSSTRSHEIRPVSSLRVRHTPPWSIKRSHSAPRDDSVLFYFAQFIAGEVRRRVRLLQKVFSREVSDFLYLYFLDGYNL